MPVNQLDMMSAQQEGFRRADEIMQELETAWGQPFQRMQVGMQWEQIKQQPGMLDYYKQNHPDAVKKMEAMYGTSNG